MLETLKTLTGSTDTTLLNALISRAQDTFKTLTGALAASDSVVIDMVLEDYTRMGAEGIKSHGYSGISESFADGYSDRVMRSILRHRKIKAL